MAGIQVHQKSAVTADDTLLNGNAITLDGSVQNLAVTFGINPSNQIYCYQVLVQSSLTNGNTVFVGGFNLDATNGIELAPGDSVPIAAQDLSQIYVLGTIGDTVKYILFTDRKFVP